MRRLFRPSAPARAGALTGIVIAVAAVSGAARASFPGEPGLIAFMSNRGGNFHIYTVKQNGKDIDQLTTDPGADQFPSWSPDGSKIAFTSTRDGNAEIYLMNADGSDQARLTSNPSYDENPVFSPDGSKVAFDSTRDAPVSCPGSVLAAVCVPYTEVYAMDFDGSNVVRLTSSPGLDRFPIFSPDGTKIAFTSSRDGNTEIYIMNADGTGQTRITNRPGGDCSRTGRRTEHESPGARRRSTTRRWVTSGS
jgi:Tol biopolymer transport system component